MSSDMAQIVSEVVFNGRLNPYPKYKDTGVDWLGEIPAHWRLHQLRRVIEKFVDYRGATPEKVPNGIPLITAKNIKKGIIDFELSQEFIKEEDYNSWMVRGFPEFGDVLVTTEAPLGESAQIIDQEIALAQRIILLKANKNHISNDYLKYYFVSDFGCGELWSRATGSTAIGIKASRLKETLITAPPLKEQKTITSYIDRETAYIDTLISKKECLITLLQEKRAALISHAVTKGLDPDVSMKDSGVEWLGEVPKEWKVRKLKHVAKVNLSNVDKKIKEYEDSVKLCNYVDVYNNDYINSDLNFMKATASPNQIEKFALREGDVLITKDSESWEDIAVPAYVPSDFDDVICGYHLAQIQPDPAVVNGEYIFRSFSSISLNYQFKVEANGITRFGIGKYQIDNSLFLVPPINEQKTIAFFLDCESIKIDSLILKIREAIEKLQEYRTALISAAVTGKIDVRIGGIK